MLGVYYKLPDQAESVDEDILWYLKNHGNQVECLVTARKAVSHSFLSKVERMAQGIIELSASPLC